MPYRKARTHPGTSTGCWHSVLPSRATLSCPTIRNPVKPWGLASRTAPAGTKYHKMMCLSWRNRPKKSLTGREIWVIWDVNGYAHMIRQHQTQNCPQSAKVPISVGLAFGATHLLQLLGAWWWRVSPPRSEVERPLNDFLWFQIYRFRFQTFVSMDFHLLRKWNPLHGWWNDTTILTYPG